MRSPGQPTTRPFYKCGCTHPHCSHQPHDCQQYIRYHLVISQPDEPIRTAPICWTCAMKQRAEQLIVLDQCPLPAPLSI